MPVFIQEKQEKAEEEETVLLSSTKIHKKSSRIEKLKENGCVYYLEKEWILIGKAESCVDIYIQEQTISRVHARIHHAQNKDFIMDMNSKNGTQINGKLLRPKEEYQLQNGDEIIFSEEAFQYFTEN